MYTSNCSTSSILTMDRWAPQKLGSLFFSRCPVTVEMVDSTMLAFTDSNEYTTLSVGFMLVLSLAFALVQKSVKDVGIPIQKQLARTCKFLSRSCTVSVRYILQSYLEYKISRNLAWFLKILHDGKKSCIQSLVLHVFTLSLLLSLDSWSCTLTKTDFSLYDYCL